MFSDAALHYTKSAVFYIAAGACHVNVLTFRGLGAETLVVVFVRRQAPDTWLLNLFFPHQSCRRECQRRGWGGRNAWQ